MPECPNGPPGAEEERNEEPGSGDSACIDEPPIRTLVSRYLRISERRTSIRLDQDAWEALGNIAAREGGTISKICTVIYNTKNRRTSLTLAVRAFTLNYSRIGKGVTASSGVRHRRAGRLEYPSAARSGQPWPRPRGHLSSSLSFSLLKLAPQSPQSSYRKRDGHSLRDE